MVLSLLGACGQHRVLHIIEIGELRPDECIIGDVVTSNVATLTNRNLNQAGLGQVQHM